MLNRPAAADAVVVLGCALRNGRPSPALTRRIACGVAVFRRGGAKLLILSGGGGEADAMREFALAHGVPERAILLEPNSRNTYENALETARLMGAHGLSSALLVTDRYHLPRARLLFRRAGLQVAATAHPPNRGVLRELPYVLRESLALTLSLARLLRAHAAPPRE